MTIQPEFLTSQGKVVGGELPVKADKDNCLMNCNNPDCREKACCKLDSESNLCRDGEGPSTAGQPGIEIETVGVVAT